MRILEGSEEAIVSDNKADVAQIVTWLSGSDVELALKQLRDTETRFEEAKKEVASSKRTLAKVLNG
jgi:hypothetical protein